MPDQDDVSADTSRNLDALQELPNSGEQSQANEVQLDFDFAAMALKGQRLDEAQRLYEKLVRRVNSPPAWCGLGLVKLHRVMEQVATIDEATFCFERARKLNPGFQAEIEAVFLNGMLNLFRSMINLYQNTPGMEAEAHKQFWLGLATTGLSALFGSGGGANLYQQLFAATGTIYGTYTSIQASKDVHKAEEFRAFALQSQKEIKERCAAFCDESSPQFQSFSKCIRGMESHLLPSKAD